MPDSGNAPAFYAATPRVSIDGQSLAADLVLALMIEETAEGLYRCELTLSNYGPSNGIIGFLHFDRSTIEFGKALKVEAGAGDGAGTIFEGRITGIEGRFFGERPPELLVLAEDKLQDLRMTRRTRSFANLDDAALFQQIGSQHGLQPAIDVSGPTHTVLAQLNQSDLAFIRERARSVDAEVWLEGSTLHVQARARRQQGDLTLTYRQGLRELSVVADLAGQVTGFDVSGWDVASKQAISHRATDSTVSGELEGRDSGGAVLTQAIGQRDQRIVHELPCNQQEAQALAEAHYRRTARRFVTSTGVAEGDARLRVGARVELKEVGPLFEGKYFVTQARHSYDVTSGYRTLFTAERPGLGRA